MTTSRAPLGSIIEALIGPPDRTEAGRKKWLCPLPGHLERTPSFTLCPSGERFHCFGCGRGGDDVELVQALNPGMGFKDALEKLGAEPGDWTPPKKPRPRPAPPPLKLDRAWTAAALEIAAEAAENLWKPIGAPALAYLIGRRGLTEETIEWARLGYWPRDREGAGGMFVFRGVTIPYFEDGELVAVKVRRGWARGREFLPETEPGRKYGAIANGASGCLYPGPDVIETGRPLILAEGEFDALILAQELGDLCPVVTLGSASASLEKLRTRNLLALTGAGVWFLAYDRDANGSGDKGATKLADYPHLSRRVRPPAPFKDWNDAIVRYDLRLYWRNILEPGWFMSMRWGSALTESEDEAGGGAEPC